MLGAASVIVDDAGRVLLVKHSYGELNWELPGGGGEVGESVYWEPETRMHHFVFKAQAIGTPHAADRAEIADVGWFSAETLPRPMSDFTPQRIRDALSDGPAVFATIRPRVWLR